MPRAKLTGKVRRIGSPWPYLCLDTWESQIMDAPKRAVRGHDKQGRTWRRLSSELLTGMYEIAREISPSPEYEKIKAAMKEGATFLREHRWREVVLLAVIRTKKRGSLGRSFPGPKEENERREERRT